jgi:multidrug efflux pump
VQLSNWFSLFFRRTHVLVLSLIVILVAGLAAFTNMPRLEDPTMDNRIVFVITKFPGASPERVESLVSDPLEDSLKEIAEIKKITSLSRTDLSFLVIEFNDDTTDETNQQLVSRVRDKVSKVTPRLPTGVLTPIVDDQREAVAFTMVVAMQPKHGDLLLASRLSDELADRLRNIPGTEYVASYGKLDEEILVSIIPEQLRLTGLTLNQVATRITSSDPKSPAGNVFGDRWQTRLQIASPLDTVERVRDILLTSDDGQFIKLGDIASVERSYKQPIVIKALHNGRQSIFISVRMSNSQRIDRWTDNAMQVIAEFDSEYGATVTSEIAFEQNHYTNDRLADLARNLLIGCIAVMITVLVFMGLRSAIIVGFSLPLCIAFVLFSLNLGGYQIQQMSIFGMIVAIGLLIDNAIVITDEIRGHIQDDKVTRLKAFQLSVQHLAIPLFASTLTTILGFMPILLLIGNIGDFIGSIAYSVISALIGSYLISMTVIAALAARFVPKYQKDHSQWWKTGIRGQGYSEVGRKFLERSLKHPKKILLSCLILPLLGFVLTTRLDNVFFPIADRNQFEIIVRSTPGSALEFTRNIVLDIDKHLSEIEGVTARDWMIGGSIPSFYYNQVMTTEGAPEYANGVITVAGVNDVIPLINQLQNDVNKKYPEALIIIKPYGLGPPIDAPLGIEIYGEDIEVLISLGDQVRLAMSKVPGVTAINARTNANDRQYIFDTNDKSALLGGLSLVEVAQQMYTSTEGRLTGSVLEGTEDMPIRLRYRADARQNIQSVSELTLTTQGLSSEGIWSPVTALGEWSMQPGVNAIRRVNGQRNNLIDGWLIPGIPPIDALKMVQQELTNMGFELPAGYSMKVAGDADKSSEALVQLSTYVPLLVALMLTTLILTFLSSRMAFIIISVALLSVGLGFFSLWISGFPLGFTSILGCAGLVGVTINGSIVVIAAIKGQKRNEAVDDASISDAVMQCSRHILSTTLTTVLGLVPLLLFSDGLLWPPLAVVIAGGVGFSVYLSLLYTPLMVSCLMPKTKAETTA